jgi:hypothetical protein
MRKKSIAVIILLCFFSQSKSQTIHSISAKLKRFDTIKRSIHSAESANQYEAPVRSSKGKFYTTGLDTARLLSDQPLKSPMGAVLRSAALPGWGQVYNRKYLKGLFVFSVNGTFAYAIYHYNREWKDTGNRKFQNKRNLYTWYFGVSYLLTLVDAYVDAYLFGFDDAVKLALPFEDQDFGYTPMDVLGEKGIEHRVIGIRVCIDL